MILFIKRQIDIWTAVRKLSKPTFFRSETFNSERFHSKWTLSHLEDQHVLLQDPQTPGAISFSFHCAWPRRRDSRQGASKDDGPPWRTMASPVSVYVCKRSSTQGPLEMVVAAVKQLIAARTCMAARYQRFIPQDMLCISQVSWVKVSN